MASRAEVSTLVVRSPIFAAVAVAAEEAAVVTGLTRVVTGVQLAVRRLCNPDVFRVGLFGVTPREVADLVAECGGQCVQFLPSRRRDVVWVEVGGIRWRNFERRLRQSRLAYYHMLVGRA